jgi:hypothetical protein
MNIVSVTPMQARYGQWYVEVFVVHSGDIVAWFCTTATFACCFDAQLWGDIHRRNQIARGVY